MDRLAVSTGIVAQVAAVLGAHYGTDSTALLVVAVATGGVVVGGLTRSGAAFVEGGVAGGVGTALAGIGAALFLPAPQGGALPGTADVGLGGPTEESVVVVFVLAGLVGILDGVVAKLVSGARSRIRAAMGV